ncbi:hypothetical protein ACTFIY_001586 [Dictyostelium cf. discoideum]
MNEKNFEILFWKVIHNKFLFKLIFFHIESFEQQYDNFKQYNLENKKKFKEIYSLDWMIEQKQYQLLKCKLLANEYIRIDGNGIRELFQIGINDEQENKILIELIQLLFEKKFLEISEIDCLLIALGCTTNENFQFKKDLKFRKININVIKMLVMNQSPFSFKIYPSTLEWAIGNCDPNIVNYLINSPNIIISEKFKNKSLRIAFNNYKYKEEMIQFILERPKLYNSNNLNQDQSISLFFTKKIKLINGNSNKLSFPDLNEKDKIKIFDYNELFSIESNLIQNKLLNLNYLKLPIELDFISGGGCGGGGGCSDFKISKNKDEFNLKVLNILNGYNLNKINELNKLLAIEYPNEFYEQYLFKFNEPIRELNGQDEIDQLLRWILSTFNINGLKWFLNNYYNDNDNNNINNQRNHIKNIQISSYYLTTTTTNIENLNELILLQFIKLYTSLENHFENEDCDKLIIKYIFKSKTKEQYDRILSCIKCNRFSNILPKKWNQIIIDLYNRNKNTIVIRDKETIDWILDNVNNKFLLKKCNYLKTTEIFQFENLETIEYACLKFVENNSNLRFSKTTEQRLLYLPFIKAISECDIEALQYIDNNKIVLKNDLIGPYRQNMEESLSIQTTENLIKLTEYLGSSGYKNFKPDCFGFFVEIITNIENPTYDLSLVKVNFNCYINKTIDLLIHSFNNSSFKIIKFILDNCNPIKTNTQSFIDQWNQSYRLNYIYVLDNSDKFYKIKYYTSNASINDIQLCIKILLKFYKNNNNNNNNELNLNLNLEYEIILKKLINYQFKRLIETNYLSIDLLNSTYQLINEIDENIIEHSFFHSFYYLTIKSKKFLKYIMGLPFITSVLKDFNNHRYDDDKNYNYIGFDIKKYLDPIIFNYQFIFESDFDIILDKLIMNLSILPSINDQQMIQKEENYLFLTLNYNLQYFLEIKRIDLFLNQLDFIQFKMNNNNNGNFNISNLTFQLIFKTISNSIDSILFQRIITFSSYNSIVNYLNNLYNQNNQNNYDNQLDYIFNNFKLFNFILLNYFNQQFELKIKNNFNNNKIQQQQQDEKSFQLQSFISSYWNNVIESFKKQFTKHIVIKYNFHLLFIENNIILSPENLKLFYSLTSSSIVLFNSISKYNRNDPFLKITKSRLLDLIRNKKLNFLKYLYENGYITNQSVSNEEDDNLLDFLKFQFKNHSEYNLVNWLK